MSKKMYPGDMIDAIMNEYAVPSQARDAVRYVVEDIKREKDQYEDALRALKSDVLYNDVQQAQRALRALHKEIDQGRRNELNRASEWLEHRLAVEQPQLTHTMKVARVLYFALHVTLGQSKVSLSRVRRRVQRTASWWTGTSKFQVHPHIQEKKREWLGILRAAIPSEHRYGRYGLSSGQSLRM